MASLFDIPNPLTPAQVAEIEAHFDAIKVIVDSAKLVITKSMTKSRIKVSIKRLALIEDVNQNLVTNYAKYMPLSISVSNYRQDLAYMEILSRLSAMAKGQASSLTILLESTSNNVMVKTTKILDSARAVDDDPNVTKVLDTLSDKHFNSQPGKKKATGFNIGKGGVITLHQAIPGKVFTNKSKYVLSILVVDGKFSETITLNPFSGAKLPAGWVNIVVTNLSDEGDALFDVFLNKQ